MFGASFSNAYEEQVRIKKKGKTAAAAAANSSAATASATRKYSFAVKLNEQQLDSHLDKVLRVFADKATARKLKALYQQAKAAGKPFDIDDAAMEEDYKVFDKEWETNRMGLSRVQYRKMGMACIRRINTDYPANNELRAKLEMFMQSISVVINSIVMPKAQFEASYKTFMQVQKNQQKMIKKALHLWGPGSEPSPEAREWMRRSKNQIEPILAKWKTLTPEQLMEEATKLPTKDQDAIAFYKMLKMIELKKANDKKKAVAAAKA